MNFCKSQAIESFCFSVTLQSKMNFCKSQAIHSFCAALTVQTQFMHQDTTHCFINYEKSLFVVLSNVRYRYYISIYASRYFSPFSLVVGSWELNFGVPSSWDANHFKFETFDLQLIHSLVDIVIEVTRSPFAQSVDNAGRHFEPADVSATFLWILS